MWASCGLRPTEQRLHLDRVGLSVRVQEVGEGPPILLVHGAMTSGMGWASLVAGLTGYRCIALDRPGCGLSDPLPGRLTDIAAMEAFADDLVVDVLDAMGIDQANVVASSLGGYLGLHAAATHPNRVNRLMLFGWTLGAPIAHTPMTMRMSSVRWLGRLMTHMPPSERMMPAMLKQIGLGQAVENGRISPEFISSYVALLRDTDTMRNEISTYPPIVTFLGGMNESILIPDALLESITVPVWFLWGEGDPFGGAETARRFSGKVPGAVLEIMSGGHAVWVDDPDHAADVTRTFLAG